MNLDHSSIAIDLSLNNILWESISICYIFLVIFFFIFLRSAHFLELWQISTDEKESGSNTFQNKYGEKSISVERNFLGKSFDFARTDKASK